MSSFKWSFISVSESTWLCVTSPKNAFCSVDRITTCKVQFWGRVSVSFLKGHHGLRNSKTNSWKKKRREKKNKQTNRWYQIVILTVLETLLETQHLKASTNKLSRFFLSPLWYFVDFTVFIICHTFISNPQYLLLSIVFCWCLLPFFSSLITLFFLLIPKKEYWSFPFYYGHLILWTVFKKR